MIVSVCAVATVYVVSTGSRFSACTYPTPAAMSNAQVRSIERFWPPRQTRAAERGQWPGTAA